MRRPRQLLPDVYSEEGHRRFLHRDLVSRELDLDAVWAEHYLFEQRLAALMFADDDGQFLFYDDGPIYERAWLLERLKRLRAALQGRAA